MMEAKFKISEVIGTSWRCTKSQIWALAGMFIAYMVVSSIASMFVPTSTPAGAGINSLMGLIISTLFLLGYIRNLFQTMDGEEPQFSAYGQEARKFLSFFVAYIVFIAVVGIGLVFLLIPGIYLAIRLQFFQQVIVSETSCSPIDALKKSWALTKGQEWPIFLLCLAMFGIMLLGLILLFVGYFVAAPLCLMIQACVYRKLVAAQMETEENVKNDGQV